jgi:hypothetical protein
MHQKHPPLLPLLSRVLSIASFVQLQLAQSFFFFNDSSRPFFLFLRGCRALFVPGAL